MQTWNPGVGGDKSKNNLIKFDLEIQSQLTAATFGAKTIYVGIGTGMLARRSPGNLFSLPMRLMMWPETGTGSHIAPEWGSFSFPDGWRGRDYFAEVDMASADQPTTFTVSSGTLPTGVSLVSTNGHSMQLEGTPTATGTFSFSLTATNVYGSDTLSFSITISDAVLPPEGNGQLFPPSVFVFGQ